jgi:ribonucleoside-triphosphate reductase (formate)
MTSHKHTGPKCPNCGSKNTYGLSRVVGYFSRINNWNKSKIAELKSRQKGNYDVTKKDTE